MSDALALDQKSVFLVPHERAVQAIRICENEISKVMTLSEIQRVMTRAEAVAALVQAMEVNDKIKKKAEFLCIRAERRLGEITKQIPSGERGRPNTTPEQHTEIIRLANEGVSHRDIAKRVGVHVSTVFNRIHGTAKPPSIESKPTKEKVLEEFGLSISQANRAEQLAKVSAAKFEDALESAPNKTRACEAMGILRYRKATPVRFKRLADDAMKLLQTCFWENRPPTSDEVNELEKRWVVCNTEQAAAG